MQSLRTSIRDLQLIRHLRQRAQAGVSVESLAFAVCAWIALTCNQTFIGKIVAGQPWSAASTWLVVAGLLLALTAAHGLILGLVLTRRTARPVLAIAVVVAVAASCYVDRYGIFLDPGMVRNALHTQPKEAIDLVDGGLAACLLMFALPAVLLISRVRIRPVPRLRSVLRRTLAMAANAVVLVATVLALYPTLAAPIREQRELRYQITPANLVWSAGRVAVASRREARGPRQPIAMDAFRRHPAATAKPLVLLLVIGETARAANWGLNGYARDTTPGLRERHVVNFTDVTSCGTDTETSLPCMFSQIGRRDYDEARIRGSDSLLHLLARVGYQVTWRDNQTGCKGVCDGLPFETIDTGAHPDCLPGRCLDEHLLDGLETRIGDQDQVIVLHMIGSHGPAYDHRYPSGQAAWTPICGQADLRRCDPAAIVNSYDNSIRYTDQVLSRAIDLLERKSATHDAALVYVSDHGESLGEHRLYLHGVPWRIAPDVQRRVPMVMWFSEGLRQRLDLDLDCLRQKSGTPVSHDHLFHTVLGLLEVTTAAREASLDLATACRRLPAIAGTPQG